MNGRGLTEKVSLVAFGTGLRTITDVVLAVVLVRLLPQEDYGTYRQFVLVFGTLVVFSSLGLPASLYYFLPRLKGRDRGALLGRILAMMGAASLVAAAALFVVSHWLGIAFSNPELANFLRLGALLPVGHTLAQVPPFYFIACSRPRDAGLYHASLSVAQVVAFLAPAVLGFGLEGVIVAATIFWLVAGTVACGLIVYVSGAIGLSIRQTDSAVHASRLLGYSVPLSLSSAVGALNARVDRYLVSIFYTPSVFAMFSVGATEVPVTNVLTYSVANVLTPEMARLDEAGKRSAILGLWHRAIGKVALLVMPIFFCLMMFADELISLLFTRDYAAASRIFRIYLLILPLRVAAYGSVLQALGLSKEVVKSALLGLSANVILGIVLLRSVGWTGPAWAAVLSQSAMVAFLISRIAGELQTHILQVFPLKKWLQVTTVAFLPVLVVWSLRLTSMEGSLLMMTGLTIYIVTYGTLLWILGWVRHGELALMQKWVSLGVFRRVDSGR